VEEKRWEAIASPAVYDHAAEPPAQAWWPHEERVDVADGDGEGIVADGAAVHRCRWGRGDQVCLFGRRIAFREVDFDVYIVCVSEGVLGEPREEKRGRNGSFLAGFGGGRGWTVAYGEFLLEEGDVTRDVVFGGGCGMDVDLG
jgi:hypothetical protein